MIRNDTSELFYAASLANGKVRLTLQDHMREISFTSKLAQDIVNFFTDEQRVLRQYKPIELRSYLIDDYIEEEIIHVLERCNEFAMVDDNDTLQTLFDSFQSYYNSQRLHNIISENREDPTKIIEKLSEVRQVSFTSLPVDRMGDLDPDKVKEEDFGGIDRVFPTACDTIRRSCTIGAGIIPGQLLQVCSPPGIGKSLFMANEVAAILKEGYKVFWCALGDLFRWDLLVRMTGIIKNIPLINVSMDLKTYFDEEMREITKNLRLSVLPADTYSVYQIRNAIESQIAAEEHIDCIIIDYDLQFARGKNGFDFLYAQGEETYNVVYKLARPQNDDPRLVYIASQPKAEFWSDECIPLSAAAESSRKAGIIDGMITIGRNPVIKDESAGIIFLPKFRRGISGERDYYIRMPTGRFQIIDENRYDNMVALNSQNQGNRNSSNKWKKRS